MTNIYQDDSADLAGKKVADQSPVTSTLEASITKAV
jgi:hypothetical protein